MAVIGVFIPGFICYILIFEEFIRPAIANSLSFLVYLRIMPRTRR